MNDREIDTAARTAWGEARSEGVTGMKAVIFVILNRLAVSKQQGDFWWGNTIEEICLKRKQFSCWNDNDPNFEKVWAVTPEDRLFEKALEIATDAIRIHSVSDITNGATHYHRAGVSPFWARGENSVAMLGLHVFYRPSEVPRLKVGRPFKTFAEDPHGPHNDSVDDDNYILCEDWDYIYEEKGIFYKEHYKEGIIYDGASVPNLLGSVADLHPNGVLRPSALPHDLKFIFAKHYFPKGMLFVWDGKKWIDYNRKWTRTQADKLFRRINREYGKMSRFKIWLSYTVLHAGSWLPWRSDDAKDRALITALYD